MTGYLDGYKDAVSHLLDVTYIKGGNNRSSGSLSGKEREAVKERFRVPPPPPISRFLEPLLFRFFFWSCIILIIEFQHRIRRNNPHKPRSIRPRSRHPRARNRRNKKSSHAPVLSFLRQVSPPSLHACLPSELPLLLTLVFVLIQTLAFGFHKTYQQVHPLGQNPARRHYFALLRGQWEYPRWSEKLTNNIALLEANTTT